MIISKTIYNRQLKSIWEMSIAVEGEKNYMLVTYSENKSEVIKYELNEGVSEKKLWCFLNIIFDATGTEVIPPHAQKIREEFFDGMLDPIDEESKVISITSAIKSLIDNKFISLVNI